MAEVVKQDPFPKVVRLDRESLEALKSKDIQLVQEVSGKLPTSFDGKPYPFRCGLVSAYEWNYIQVGAPSLIRLDYIPAPAPDAFDTSSFFQSLEIVAASRKFANSLGALGGQNYGGSPMLRGVGPLIYLPSEGEYGIGIKGVTSAAVTIMGSILEGIDHTIASAYLQGQVLHRNIILPRETLAPAVAQSIPNDANLLLARGYSGRFAAGYMRIFNVGANPCNIAIGNAGASALVGNLLAVNGIRFITWQELIGCSVSAFSTAGTDLEIQMRTV